MQSRRVLLQTKACKPKLSQSQGTAGSAPLHGFRQRSSQDLLTLHPMFLAV